MNKSSLLLVADSHVQPGTPLEEEFFSMLNWLETTDYDVLFLGDNLDLWIASGERYETDVHRRFLEWCSREKSRRRVIMVEGNHEFYLKRHHAQCFTVCEETFFQEGEMLFLHGDISQRKFGFHRCFRVFAKNAFGDWVMGWLPFGPAFARVMKHFLSSGGMPDREKLLKPMATVRRYAADFCERFGVKHIRMGHFHIRIHEDLEKDCEFDVVPAWKTCGEIGLIEADGRLNVLPWRDLRDKVAKGGSIE
ncbi:MAG: metallophosphoesterase [Victivallales bacterium]|nr:metallophosphoesterase [Victivallales bacterium]